MLVGNKFPPIPRKHGRVSCGTINKNENSCSANEFLIKLKHHQRYLNLKEKHILTFVIFPF